MSELRRRLTAPCGHAGLVIPILLLVSSWLVAQEAPLFMWQVSTDSSRMTMIGSIHVLDESFYPLPEPMLVASDEADILALEINLDLSGQQAIQQHMLSNGYFTDGTSLYDLLSIETLKELNKSLDLIGFPREAAGVMRPWLISLVLTAQSLIGAGYDPALGLDEYLFRRHGDREVVELEGARFQIELFAGLDLQTQIFMLEDALYQRESIGVSMEHYLSAWKEGNPGALEDEVMSSGDPVSDRLTDLLFGERNRRMAAGAAELLRDREGNILLVVGAGHFVGPGGIPALLGEMGYEVRQVATDGSLLPSPHPDLPLR